MQLFQIPVAMMAKSKILVLPVILPLGRRRSGIPL
jgi:hypothetical protein